MNAVLILQFSFFLLSPFHFLKRIICHAVFINEPISFNALHPVFGGQFENCTYQQRRGTNGDAGSPLTPVERNDGKDAAEDVDKEVLEDNADCENDNKVPVVQDAFEDVEVTLANLSAVDHVEKLHHDERVEQVSQMTHLCLRGLVCQVFCRQGVARVVFWHAWDHSWG